MPNETSAKPPRPKELTAEPVAGDADLVRLTFVPRRGCRLTTTLTVSASRLLAADLLAAAAIVADRRAAAWRVLVKVPTEGEP